MYGTVLSDFRDEYRKIFWTVIGSHMKIFPNRYALAYDGSHQLYTPNKVTFPDGRASVIYPPVPHFGH